MGATKPKGGARPQAFAGTEKSEQFAAELSQSAPPWLFCGRALDATPYEVEFGDMADELFQTARYRYLDPHSGKWTLLPHDAAARLNLKCKRGVCELLGQSAKLAWTEPAQFTDSSASLGVDITRVERLVVRPVFLESSSASNTFTAMEEVMQGLSLDRLKQMAMRGTWIALYGMWDSSAANTRMGAYIASHTAL